MKNDNELINKLIFGKYQILKSLGKGSFCDVYLIKNIKTKKLYAAKIEEKISSLGRLEKEAYFLYILKGFGIPEVITYGHSGKYNILIEQLLGKSLKELLKISKNKIKDVCMSAIQIIDILRYVHSKYIVHRDIKPENFLIGNPDLSNIYIIDFGLSRKYRSSRTGKHIEFSINKTIPGTAGYLSLNATTGVEQTRRDDLESLAYMLIYLAKGKLPWTGIKGKNVNECIYKAYLMKSTISLLELCKDLPKEFITFTKYIRQLKFEQEPDYNYLKNLFIHVLKTMKETNDLKFSWIKIEKFPSKNDSEIILKNRSPFHKSSSRTRLLKKIENLQLSERIIIPKNNTHFKENSKNSIKYKSDIIKINNKTLSPKNSIIENKNNKNNIFQLKNLKKNKKINCNNISSLQTGTIFKTDNNYIGLYKKNLNTNNNIKNLKIINTGNFVHKITNNIIFNNSSSRKYFIRKNITKKNFIINNIFRDKRKSPTQFSTINVETYTNKRKINSNRSMKYIPLMLRTGSQKASSFSKSKSCIVKNNSHDYKNKKGFSMNNENILTSSTNNFNNSINLNIRKKIFNCPTDKPNNDYKTLYSLNNNLIYHSKFLKYNNANSLDEGINYNTININYKGEDYNNLIMFKYTKK